MSNFQQFCKRAIQLVLVFLISFPWPNAQEPESESDGGKSDRKSAMVPSIDQFSPKSMLRVPQTRLRKSKYPAIDIHGHFGFRIKGDDEALVRYVEIMNRNNIALSASLDAKLGEETEHMRFLEPFADRFLIFCHLDFVGQGDVKHPETHACNKPDFVRNVCERLTVAKKSGIVGLKFFKQFGLGYQNADGSLVRINDRRFDPVWEKCAELELPVLIHTGDPAAFFEPIDDRNERFEELLRHPDWSFRDERFPRRESLLKDRNEVIARHPRTQFIGAHLGGNVEDLATVAKWLEEFPNLHVDIASRIGELGRQPFTAREFFITHPDRILFGTDGPWPEERLTYYWRFLETKDEYFPYSEKQPQPQGLWYIYGLNLPDSVLEKVYFRNTLQLIPTAVDKYRAVVNSDTFND